MHMRQIFSLLMALTLCVGTAGACMKKGDGLRVTGDGLRGNQPLTVIVMDTTQALLANAEVKVQKDVYTTSFDGRVVLKPEQVTSTTFLVSCEGYKPAHAIVKDESVLIVRLLPDPKARPKNGEPVMIRGTGRLRATGSSGEEVLYSKAATPTADAAMLSFAEEADEMPARESMVVMPGGTNGNVAAGLLTAGEVNDFTKWYFWPRVIEDSHKQHISAWQIAPRHRYTAQVVNKAGYPIASKAVSLLDQSGNTLFQAVTDNTGKAELWYQLIGNNLCGKHTDLYLLVDDRKQVAKQWSEGLNTFVLDEACEAEEDVDVFFIFDATGSMGDELRYLQAEMKDVIARAKEATGGLEIRTGAVVYRDHQDDYLTRISRLTDDIKATQAFIDKQQASGGGDYPEAVPEALMAALNSAGWDSDARARIAFLILDAPCHQDSATIALLHEQVLNAAALGVRIVPVVCSGIGESGELLVRSIALATNGTSFFLTDDSGIGNPHLKPTTDSLKVEHLNDMMVRTIVEFSAMPECNGGLINGDAAEPLNGEMVDPQFLPNPFSAEEVAADPSIPHGEGIHYLIDVSGKLITVYEGDTASLKTQLRSMGLPVGIYFIKTFYDGIWHTEKILNH